MWLKNELKRHPDRMFVCWGSAIGSGLLSHIAGIICQTWVASAATRSYIFTAVACLTLVVIYTIGVWFIIDENDFDVDGFCANLIGGVLGFGITVLSLPWFNIA